MRGLFMRKQICAWMMVSLSYFLPTGELLAQSSSVSNTSTMDLGYRFRRFLEGIEIQYNSISAFSTFPKEESEFEGKVDYDESPTGRMLNEIHVGHEIAKHTSASIVGVWTVQPQADESEETKTFEVLDPYAKFSFEEIIERGGFEFSSDFRIGLPASRESKEVRKVVSFGSQQELEYQFGKSPVHIELELYFQYNVQRTQEPHNDVDVRVEPAVFYSFSDKVYSRLSYESKMHHQGDQQLMLVDNNQPAVQAGIGWHISRKLEILPYVDINLKEPGTRTALYGAMLAWDIR